MFWRKPPVKEEEPAIEPEPCPICGKTPHPAADSVTVYDGACRKTWVCECVNCHYSGWYHHTTSRTNAIRDWNKTVENGREILNESTSPCPVCGCKPVPELFSKDEVRSQSWLDGPVDRMALSCQDHLSVKGANVIDVKDKWNRACQKYLAEQRERKTTMEQLVKAIG